MEDLPITSEDGIWRTFSDEWGEAPVYRDLSFDEGYAEVVAEELSPGSSERDAYLLELCDPALAAESKLYLVATGDGMIANSDSRHANRVEAAMKEEQGNLFRQSVLRECQGQKVEFASDSSHVDIKTQLQELLDSKADIDAEDAFGNTALLLVSAHRNHL